MASAAGFGKLLKEVAKPSLSSGAFATGMSLLTGGSPIQAVATGLVDTAASAAPLLALRKLNPGAYGKRVLIDKNTGKEIVQNVTSPLETPLNIASSIGAGFLANPVIYGGQEQQMSQQVMQRSLVNQLPMQEQMLSPGTQFQMAGLPPTDDFQNLLNKKSNWSQYLSPEDQALLQQTLGGY